MIYNYNLLNPEKLGFDNRTIIENLSEIDERIGIMIMQNKKPNKKNISINFNDINMELPNLPQILNLLCAILIVPYNHQLPIPEVLDKSELIENNIILLRFIDLISNFIKQYAEKHNYLYNKKLYINAQNIQYSSRNTYAILEKLSDKRPSALATGGGGAGGGAAGGGA